MSYRWTTSATRVMMSLYAQKVSIAPRTKSPHNAILVKRGAIGEPATATVGRRIDQRVGIEEAAARESRL